MLTDKNWVPVARGKGDGFMVAGATLYGFTNATEEFFVRKRPLYEVVGSLGMFGFMISAIQASGLEHVGMREATWSGFNGKNCSSLWCQVGLMLTFGTGSWIAHCLYCW